MEPVSDTLSIRHTWLLAYRVARALPGAPAEFAGLESRAGMDRGPHRTSLDWPFRRWKTKSDVSSARFGPWTRASRLVASSWRWPTGFRIRESALSWRKLRSDAWGWSSLRRTGAFSRPGSDCLLYRLKCLRQRDNTNGLGVLIERKLLGSRIDHKTPLGIEIGAG